MRNRRSVAIIVGLAAALVFTALPGQAASGDDGSAPRNERTYIDTSGVVHYKFDPLSLPGNRERTETGSRSGDGSCSFEVTGSGNASTARGHGTAIVGVEVSFDPATCTRQLAEASYPADDVPAAVLDAYASTAGMQSAVEATSSPAGSVSLAATQWNGFINGYYNDPIPANVTRTEASFTWSSAGAVRHYNRWTWLSGTGWSRTAYSTGNTSTGTNTRANYTNVIFCNPVVATYTNHTRTEFRGYSNGTWDYGWASSKSGDCSSLLTAGYYAQTP